ncbi:MAG: LiaF transmembrane domain-containing protein, partial [Chitinophagaceae bacterium]
SGGQNRFLSGVLLLAAGLFVLLYKLGAPIPGWLVSWPMILIVVGIFNAVQHRFENPTWLILIFVGLVFLSEKAIPGLRLRNYILPIILIAVGTFFVLKPRKKVEYQTGFNNSDDAIIPANQNAEYVATNIPDAEQLDINSVFGGAKRVVLSKNFQGGEINCLFGGAEVYLQQADIQGVVNLEVNCVFGGGKLVVPSHWDVKIISTNVLGGVNDKRQLHGVITQANKVLIIKATCVFGGLEISNY